MKHTTNYFIFMYIYTLTKSFSPTNTVQPEFRAIVCYIELGCNITLTMSLSNHTNCLVPLYMVGRLLLTLRPVPKAYSIIIATGF